MAGAKTRGLQLVLAAALTLGPACSVWAQSAAGSHEDRGTSRPRPGDPGAISWTGEDWLLIGSGAMVGEAIGVVGVVALYWSLSGACEGRTYETCYRGHRPSTLAIALALGAPAGATLGAGVTGGALGYEGTAGRTLVGAYVGLLMFGAAFGPFVDVEVSVPLGTTLALLTVPWSATLFYYISQENAVRVGETASLLHVTPERGVELGVPLPLPALVEDRLGVALPLLGGRF